MSDRDPEELADQLDQEADQLGEQSKRLASRTSDVRDDWERKRSDQNVPGAVARESEGEEGDSGDGGQ